MMTTRREQKKEFASPDAERCRCEPYRLGEAESTKGGASTAHRPHRGRQEGQRGERGAHDYRPLLQHMGKLKTPSTSYGQKHLGASFNIRRNFLVPPTNPWICAGMAHAHGGVPSFHQHRVDWHQPELRGGFHPKLGFPPPRAFRHAAATRARTPGPRARGPWPPQDLHLITINRTRNNGAHFGQDSVSRLGEPRADQRLQQPATQRCSQETYRHILNSGIDSGGVLDGGASVPYNCERHCKAGCGTCARKVPSRQPLSVQARELIPAPKRHETGQAIQWIALDTRPRGRSRSPFAGFESRCSSTVQGGRPRSVKAAYVLHSTYEQNFPPNL